MCGRVGVNRPYIANGWIYGMRQFFILIAFIGVLLVIDFIAFGGRYSAEVWQESQYLGQKFSSNVQFQIGKLWR